MQWFMAVMPAYPNIQQKAQEELDRVVGRDRLPLVEDESELPYCRALIKELARVYNPFWLINPHMVSEDFTYRDYFIPRGAVVVVNAWTIHHDERRWANPDHFDVRFFKRGASLMTNTLDT